MIKISLFIVLILCCFPSRSQNTNALPEEAAFYFQQRAYTKAAEIYSNLLNKYPKDPDYHYKMGMCLYYLNIQHKKAIHHLQFVTGKQFPSQTYYTIGKLYHFSYQFDRAIENYNKYKAISSKKEILASDVDELIAMARNAKSVTKEIVAIHVLQKDTFLHPLVVVFISSNNNKFELVNKPDSYKSTYEIKENINSYMYKPITQSSILVYTLASKKTGRDIMISGIEPLSSEINTAQDEDFGYFDTKNETLYFSSKGHNSIGGYDIFRTKYNARDKTWSTPENLGFPINSPYDEILFNGDSVFYFASNRSVSLYEDKYITYRTIIPENASRTANKDSLEIYASLPIYTPSPKFIKLSLSEENDNENSIFIDNKKLERQHNELIGKALALQFKADSLMQNAKIKREKVRITTDNAKRTQLFRDIRIQEAQSKLLKEEAKSLFTEASKLEEQIHASKEEHPYIELDTIINSIKVYHFKEEAYAVPTKEVKDNTYKKNEISKSVSSKELTIKRPTSSPYSFTIEKSSPYSSSNPIPMNTDLPDGVIYKIQLGVYSKKVENEFFGGLNPISGVTIPEKGLFKYYTGIFNNYDKASETLVKVKQYGYKDAFIVSFYNKQKISVNRAKELE